MDQTVTYGTCYYYIVTAVNSGWESEKSNEVTITPYDPMPAVPADLAATAANLRVTLNWVAASGAAWYSVKKASVAGGPYSTVASNIVNPTWDDTAVINGTAYYYIVTATNEYGESGASNQATATPHQIIITPRIDGGGDHTVALKDDGTLWVWGYNYYGQLGNGTNTSITIPQMLQNISEVKVVATGGVHTLALKTNGTVWAWGNNQNSQLGDGSLIHRNLPVQVANLYNVKAVSAGSYHSLALREDGTVWAWGDNFWGQLGDGTSTSRSISVRVTGLTDIEAIATGGNFNIALKRDGTVWSWGDNYTSSAGSTIVSDIPVQLPGFFNVRAIACGGNTAYLLKNDGTVWAWGGNEYGQIGDGTTISKYAPVQVQNLGQVVAIAGGAQFAVAALSDGTLRAWGRNNCGQIGDGSPWDRSLPTQPMIYLYDVISVGCGASFAFGIRSDGSVVAWGENGEGQLGDGTKVDKGSPVPIPGLDLITAPTPPLTPAYLIANSGDTKVTLTWEAAAGAQHYTVKRSSTAGGPYTVIATNAAGESGATNEAVGTPYQP